MNRFQLSQKDANSTLELIHASLSCHNVNAFLQLLERQKYLIGFEYAQCVYGDFTQYADKKRDAFITACTFPDTWVERYVKNDPVVQLSLAEGGPQYWADAFIKCQSPQTIIFQDEAASAGLSDGWMYTMPFGHSSLTANLSLSGKHVKKTPGPYIFCNSSCPINLMPLKRHVHLPRCKKAD
jgi:hypothetical protein